MQTKFIVQSSHFQIGLWDAASNDSYPEFSDDYNMLDLVFFGPKGVVVTTEGSEDIEVVVTSKEASAPLVAEKKCLGNGIIEIGDRGVEIGNIITDDIYQLPCPAGMVSIEIWEIESLEYPISVVFVLDTV